MRAELAIALLHQPVLGRYLQRGFVCLKLGQTADRPAVLANVI